MATLASLRERSERIFTSLLRAQATRRPARGRAAARREEFSWFEPSDAIAAAALSFRLAALAASRAKVNTALELALDHVDEEVAVADPERVRQGFALFVTHNRDGRRLAKPRTVTAAPDLFRPPRSRPRRGGSFPISIGGAAPQLDYWREDSLANEHHQHWHEVYPYTGLPPSDFRAWVTATPQSTMLAILEELAPQEDWAAALQGASVAQLAQLFAQVVRADAVANLSRPLYRVLFRLNDRQGELFFYMHEQMLARYDAELASNGLARVKPFSSGSWRRPIAEGHDPVGLPGYGVRTQDRTLAADAVSLLRRLDREVREALTANALRDANGGSVSIDRTNLGEAVESAVAQLRDSDPDRYGGVHNLGHGRIAALSSPSTGVMRSTVTAIRDQIFWRWHKYVDNINAEWQATQAPYDLSDAPRVMMRNGIDAGSTEPWASPDIILCRTADLPAGDQTALGARLFGGSHWSEDFTSGTASAGEVSVPTTTELTTTMATAMFNGNAVRYLTHEPFSYFLRIENRSNAKREITVRIFLATSAQARDRRAWIEMDKFMLSVPARTKFVVHRPDTEASVVKRPVDTGLGSVGGGASGPDENSYCDCGWPYPLLLPRGTSSGLNFRLLVVCTDAAIDRVPTQDHCGSMSFCGAVDRYPDARDMGYPFSRPFSGVTATAIRDTFVALDSAAARTVTIRHL